MMEPKMEPCGTPEVDLTHSDATPFMTTRWCPSSKYETNNLSVALHSRNLSCVRSFLSDQELRIRLIYIVVSNEPDKPEEKVSSIQYVLCYATVGNIKSISC